MKALPTLTKASNVVLTMADSDAIRKTSTIALAGGRAFFVPACWLYLNLEEKS